MLSTALRVLVRCWPALLAWFLVGWTVRALIIRGAGVSAQHRRELALPVLPLAILAQLAAFVGMFFAIRRELPHVNRVDDVGCRRDRRLPRLVSGAKRCSPPSCRSSCSTSRGTSIRTTSSTSSLRRSTKTTSAPTIHGNDHRRLDRDPRSSRSPRRWVLGRFAARLPRWVSLVATYFEAVWVFVALSLIRDALGLLGGWLVDPPHVRRPRRRLGSGARDLRVDRRDRRRNRLGMGSGRHARRSAPRLAGVRLHHLLRHDAAVLPPRARDNASGERTMGPDAGVGATPRHRRQLGDPRPLAAGRPRRAVSSGARARSRWAPTCWRSRSSPQQASGYGCWSTD